MPHEGVPAPVPEAVLRRTIRLPLMAHRKPLSTHGFGVQGSLIAPLFGPLQPRRSPTIRSYLAGRGRSLRSLRRGCKGLPPPAPRSLFHHHYLRCPMPEKCALCDRTEGVAEARFPDGNVGHICRSCFDFAVSCRPRSRPAAESGTSSQSHSWGYTESEAHGRSFSSGSGQSEGWSIGDSAGRTRGVNRSGSEDDK